MRINDRSEEGCGCLVNYGIFYGPVEVREKGGGVKVTEMIGAMAEGGLRIPISAVNARPASRI